MRSIRSLLLLPALTIAQATVQLPQIEVPAPKKVYMVWDKTCITKIEPTEHLYMDAPMKDGKPEMKKVQIYGQLVTFEPGCGRIEIRGAK
jgi:hypothetical protein